LKFVGDSSMFISDLHMPIIIRLHHEAIIVVVIHKA
jgi:hypothetical protein